MAKKIDDAEIDAIKQAWFKWQELKSAGVNKPISDMAKEIGVSLNTFKKYRPDDIQVDDVEELAKGKAEGSVISDVVKDISKNATMDHERTLLVGKWVREEYEDMAKAYGLEVEEFVAGAVNFWDIYKDRVKELEADNKKMESYIEALINILSKEQMMERIINNAVNTSIALGIELNVDELRKLIKLVKEEVM